MKGDVVEGKLGDCFRARVGELKVPRWPGLLSLLRFSYPAVFAPGAGVTASFLGSSGE